MAMTYESRNRQELSKIQPHVAKKAQEALDQADREGLDILVTDGLRTYAEQASLYAKGRTKPGSIVTNAKPGQSYHNFGLAFDMVVIKNGKAIWSVGSEWRRFAAIAKSKGFEWGGDWSSFKDYPHFQMTGGLSLARCRSKWPGGYKGTSGGGSINYKADDNLPLSVGSKDGKKKLVSKLQKRLQIKADGYFGPATKSAVMNWQRVHDEDGNVVPAGKGLAVDGIVGEKTWGALFPDQSKPSNDSPFDDYDKNELPKAPNGATFTRTLKVKKDIMHGKDVEAVQAHRFVKPHLKGKVDGYYGPDTEQAVKKYQKTHGIKVTGEIGDANWKYLFSNVEEPKPEPKKEYWKLEVDGKKIDVYDHTWEALAEANRLASKKTYANEANVKIEFTRILK